jgi:hypothetical protein
MKCLAPEGRNPQIRRESSNDFADNEVRVIATEGNKRVPSKVYEKTIAEGEEIVLGGDADVENQKRALDLPDQRRKINREKRFTRLECPVANCRKLRISLECDADQM